MADGDGCHRCRMDSTALFLVLNFFIYNISADALPAAFTAPVKDLWSNFELQLQDAIFEAMDLQQNHRRRSARDIEEIWTGFVPSLYQQREQLVVDSLQVVSSMPVCSDNNDDRQLLLDSVQHNKNHYVTATCGDQIKLYRLGPSGLILLDSRQLPSIAVKLRHVKLFDTKSGDVNLFHLVLMSRTLEVYLFRNEMLELHYKQELLHDYTGLDVFYVDGATYCLLIKKIAPGEIQLGILQLTRIESNEIAFNFLTSKVLQEVSSVRLCNVHGLTFMIRSNISKGLLHIDHFKDGHLLEHHQTISASGIKDFACFHLGATHYLALASSESSLTIFQYIDGLYRSLQDILVSGVTTITPLYPSTYRDETFLMVSGPRSADLLIINATTLVFEPLRSTCPADKLGTQRPLSLNASDVACLAQLADLDASVPTSISQDQGISLILPNKGNALLVTIHSHLQPVASPVVEQLARVQARVDASKAAASAIEARSKDLAGFAEGIVLYDSDVRLEGSWKVGTLEVPSVPVEKLDNRVEFNQDVWIPGLDTVVDDITEKVQVLEQLIADIENRLKDSIVNGTFNEVEFDALEVSGPLIVGQLKAVELSLAELNHLKFSELVADVVQRDSDRLMESLKIIGTLTTEALNATRVNNILVKDVATNDKDFRIKGNLVIENDVQVTGNVIVEGKVNGIDLSSQLMTPDQSFDSLSFMDHVETDELVLEGKLDGVNVNQVLPNVVVNLTAETKFRRVQFDHLIIDGNLNVKSGMVGGVNLEALNSSAIRLDANETVTDGSLNFTKGVVIQSLDGVSEINDIPFEDMLPKSTNFSNVKLTGVKTFQGPVKVRQLVVDGLVNGHRLENAFTLDTNQTVNGTVHLQGGFEVVNGDLHMGSLNNVDWLAIMEQGVHPALLSLPEMRKNVTLNQPVFIGGQLVSNELKVPGETEFLEDILQDLVYADAEDVVIRGRKTLSSLSLTGDMEVDGYVNGYKLLDDLLVANKDQEITGHYQLEGDVEFSSLNVDGRLNDYDLDDLLGNVLQFDGSPVIINSRLLFDQVDVSGQFLVNGSINGVQTDRMVLQGADQAFTAPQILVSPSFGRLDINGSLRIVDQTSRINDIDLDIFDRSRVTLTTDQGVKGRWTLNTANISTFSLKKLNGLTLEQWKKDFLRSHSAVPQVINARTIDLNRLEVFGSVVTSGSGINGFNLTKLNQTAGDIRTDITFPADVSFDHLEADGMRINGSFNGFPLRQLRDQAVFLGEPRSISGIKRFKRFRVKGDVDAELINGRHLIDSYLHVSANQTIESPLHVDSIAATDLNLKGVDSSLNGVPSGILLESQTLPYNLHRGNVVIQKPINVSSLVIPSLQGEDWKQLISSLALINQTNQFRGSVTFTDHLKVEGSLKAGKVNEVDLVAFAKDVVLVDEVANITAKKVFQTLKVNRLGTPEIRSESVSPDVVRAANEAVRLDRNETVQGPIHFESLRVRGDVLVSTLNGEPFPAGYVTQDSDQQLESNLVADRIFMSGDIQLEEGALVNGVDLRAEFDNTWMSDETDKVLSTKTFKGKIRMMKDLSVTQTVNKVANFSQEVVQLSEGGTIYGAPNWKDFVVNGDVSRVDLTNDVDLADLAARAAYLDQPIVTKAKWSAPMVNVSGKAFLMPVEASINDAPFTVGQLNGKNVSSSRMPNQVDDRKVFEGAQQWYEALRRAYFKMDHLDLNQSIFLPHSVTAISSMRVHGSSLLLVGTRAGSLVYRRQPDGFTFSLAGIPAGTGSVSKWLPLDSGLVVSLATPTPLSSNTTGAKLWNITSVEPLQMELIQDFGPGVSDITGEAIHNLRFTNQTGQLSRSLPMVELSDPGASSQLQVFERVRAPSSVGLPNPLISDLTLLHRFQLRGKQMIAMVMTFPSDVSASLVGCPGVRLYSTSTGSMKLEHIIPSCDVRAVTSFTHGNFPDDYLLLAEHDAVTVYGFEGASGFVERFRLPYPSAGALHSWIDDGELVVAVGKADRVAIHKAITIGAYIQD